MISISWDAILYNEFECEYFINLMKFVNNEYQCKTIYPKQTDIFNALKSINYEEVKVLIIGQDPYHGENEAHGLAFSVLNNCKRPPSLNNIFKELKNDLGVSRTDNNLSDWSKQGVLLLNAIMTVEKDKPLSHKNMGWEQFTDAIISSLNNRVNSIVFVLWGNYARSKKKLITNNNHYIIECVHPSPLSANRGFFGSKPFTKINNFLELKGIESIKW